MPHCRLSGTLNDARMRELARSPLFHSLRQAMRIAAVAARANPALPPIDELIDMAGSRRIVADLAQRVGGIDVLVNNAALIVNRPFEAFSLAEYEEQMRVNAGAAFALSQAVAPGMKAKKAGSIINFCSITLGGEWEGYVPYVASKGALLGLTRSLARELGPYGVRVNAVSPGAVVSEAEARVFGARADEYNKWVLQRQCLPGRIQPEDVAEAVLFLAGEGARMISGHMLEVNGGW